MPATLKVAEMSWPSVSQVVEAKWETYGHEAKQTIKICIGCALYFGFGVLFYSRIEGWNISTSLYFLMVTASTVGYGDLYPGAGKDDEWKAQYLAGSRAFSLIYLFLGVVVVFAQASALLAHKFRPLFRISRNAIERAFPQKGIDIDNDGTFDFKVPRSPPYYYGKHLLGPITFIVAVQIISAVIFMLVEPGLDFGTAMYHCLVTATTVGYGDVSLTTDGSYLWAFFHILLSVSLLTAIIGDVSELAAARKQALHKLTLLKGRLDFELMKSLDVNGDGVDKFEFVFGA